MEVFDIKCLKRVLLVSAMDELGKMCKENREFLGVTGPEYSEIVWTRSEVE